MSNNGTQKYLTSKHGVCNESVSSNNEEMEVDQFLSELENVLLPSRYPDLGFLNENDGFDFQNYEQENPNVTHEEDAFIRFFEKFDSNYGTAHINFECYSLKQVIRFSCFTPGQDGKLLILYLHNENDEFSQIICPEFVGGSIRIILERSFDLLPWDLSSSDTNSALELVIDEWPTLHIIKNWIKKGQAGLFVLAPGDGTVNIVSKWDKKNSIIDVLVGLKEIEKIFFNQVEDEEEEKKQTKMGPREFQQQMCDHFCNQDYLSFQPSEHDLLKSKIGYSKFGAPLEEGYNERQRKLIENTYRTIVTQSNKHAEFKDHVVISIIFNCFIPKGAESNTNNTSFPIYVIRKCFCSSDPCRIFIDHNDRVYNSWISYLKNNKLPKGLMVVPKDGRYRNDYSNQVDLETYPSPECNVKNAVIKRTDMAAGAVGIGGTGTLLLAGIPTLAIAPVALTCATVSLVGCGIYSIVRSSMSIHDKRIHCEDLKITNKDARAAYLNIVAASLSFAGMGATKTVSCLAQRGIALGENVKTAAEVVHVANIGFSAVNVVNSSYHLFDDWRHHNDISRLSILQFSTSLLFFGHAVYNFKTTNVIIREGECNKVIRMIQDALRQKTGNIGNSQVNVILPVTEFYDKNEVLTFLKEHNTLLNERGIEVDLRDDKITLNGNVVKIQDLLNDSSINQASTGNNSMEIVKNTLKHICSLIFRYLQNPDNFSANVTMDIINYLKPTFRRKLLQLCKLLLDTFEKKCGISWKVVDDTLCEVSASKEVRMIKFVITFLSVEINRNSKNHSETFGETIVMFIKQFLSKAEFIIDIILSGTRRVGAFLFDKIFNFVFNKFIVVLMYWYRKQKLLTNRIQSGNYKLKCKICFGDYFSS